jgi:exonuclease III
VSDTLHSMHIIQWNVNGLRTRLPELDILRTKYSPAAICLQETHLRPTHTASLRGYASYRYDHLPGERANGGTAIFIRDSVYSCQVQLQSNIQAVAVQIYTDVNEKLTLQILCRLSFISIFQRTDKYT